MAMTMSFATEMPLPATVTIRLPAVAALRASPSIGFERGQVHDAHGDSGPPELLVSGERFAPRDASSDERQHVVALSL
jgi:hypothetical protein